MEIVEVQNFPTSQTHAVATTDIAFKKLHSINHGCDKNTLLTLLNSFVTIFREDPLIDILEVPTKLSVAAHIVEKLSFVDYEGRTTQGARYFIEIQSQLDAVVEESALFHWCGAYTRQLSTVSMNPGSEWFTHLKPVIILQFCNYADHKKYRIHSTTYNEFIKHYSLSEKTTSCQGGEVEHLHVVQIDMSRVEASQSLFPPSSVNNLVKDCTEKSCESNTHDQMEEIMNTNSTTLIPSEKPLSFTEWWMSLLLHAHEYTNEMINALIAKNELPCQIIQAFQQLNINNWNPLEKAIYLEELASSNVYQVLLLQERSSGRRQGILECATKLLNSAALDEQKVIATLKLNEAEVLMLRNMTSSKDVHSTNN